MPQTIKQQTNNPLQVMKIMKTISAVLFLSLNLWPALGADILTFGGLGSSYTVSSNSVVEVIAGSARDVNRGSAAFTYRTTSATNNFQTVVASFGVSDNRDAGGIISLLPIVLAGPGEITSSDTITIRVRTKAEYLASYSVPAAASSTSVVIPEDSAGPVTVVLESSTDLVNWTAANPGTYGSSTVKRFFRVRAIINGN